MVPGRQERSLSDFFLLAKVELPRGIIVLFGIFILNRKRVLFAFSIRAALLGIVLFSIIPIVIKVGDLVDDSFGRLYGEPVHGCLYGEGSGTEFCGYTNSIQGTV